MFTILGMNRGAQELEQWIVRRRIKPRVAALELGITPTYLWMLRNGVRLPGRDLALKIQDTAGIGMAEWTQPAVNKSLTSVSGVKKRIKRSA